MTTADVVTSDQPHEPADVETVPAAVAAEEVESTEKEEAAVEPERPEWAMLLWCGAGDGPHLDGVTTVNVTPASTAVEDVVAPLSTAGLTPADLRSRVLFVADPAVEYRDRAVAAYAAVCGFAGRRVDARVGEEQMALADFDRVLRTAADAGRPEQGIEQAQVGADRADMPSVSLDGGFTPQVLSVVRFAKRLRFVPPASTPLALTQFVAVAAVRARAGMDRFPMLVVGDEPGLLPVDEAGFTQPVGVCLHTIRRAAEQLRRASRGDNREAIADFVEPSPRQKHLVSAAAVPVVTVLELLEARSKTVEVPARDGEGEPTQEVLWHCLRPQNHTNGDASPSAKVMATYDGGEGFRCFRCLPETVDVLRLVMWALDLSVDEAADWIHRRTA